VKPLVLKLGGELIEQADDRHRLARFARDARAARGLIVVHGGGRVIDAELERRHIVARKVEGLRVTDAATLDAVVSVLAGSINTDLVAALVGEGVPAVGLTGVDAGFSRAARSDRHPAASGATVDLGLVGDPDDVDPDLVELLVLNGYVPVIASLGIENRASSGRPRVLNVNADVMACRVAAALVDADLVIAGSTPGVLDDKGHSIAELDLDGLGALIASGVATAGMVAKLSACRTALEAGVASVRIIDGRCLDAGEATERAPGTRIVTSKTEPPALRPADVGRT
jgi:acetylglutamate kinase